jgi:hypothetical protein
VQITGFAMLRVANGRIMETWVEWDTFDLAMQIGLVVVPVSSLCESGCSDGAPHSSQPGRPY